MACRTCKWWTPPDYGCGNTHGKCHLMPKLIAKTSQDFCSQFEDKNAEPKATIDPARLAALEKVATAAKERAKNCANCDGLGYVDSWEEGTDEHLPCGQCQDIRMALTELKEATDD